MNHAHVTTFPFENLDVMAGRAIRLDVPSLQDKFVRRGRGGYCYEQNCLFAAVLERLGFTVTGVNARILGGSPDHVLRAAGHTALLIAWDDHFLFTDVGVGAVGTPEPVDLAPGRPVTHPDGRRTRLDRTDHGLWVLYSDTGAGWQTVHKFSTDRAFRADYVDANYIAQHHPRSPFHKTYLIDLFDGAVHRELRGLTVVHTGSDGARTERTLTPAAVPGAVEELFGIALSPTERELMVRRSRPISDGELMGDRS